MRDPIGGPTHTSERARIFAAVTPPRSARTRRQANGFCVNQTAESATASVMCVKKAPQKAFSSSVLGTSCVCFFCRSGTVLRAAVAARSSMNACARERVRVRARVRACACCVLSACRVRASRHQRGASAEWWEREGGVEGGLAWVGCGWAASVWGDLDAERQGGEGGRRCKRG